MNIKTRQRGFNPDNHFASISLGSALAIGGGSLASGLLGAGASNKAAKYAKKAAKYGIDEQARQYNLTRSDLQPWQTAGVNALGQYEAGIGQSTPMYGAFQGGSAVPQYTNQVANPEAFQDRSRFNFNLQEDPIYQYQRDEALRASTRGANASGGAVSGGLLNELARVGAGEAGKYQDNAFARQLASSRENYGRSVGEYGMDTARNRDIYGRGVQDYGLNLQGNQAQYGRDLGEYQLDVGRNQDMYGRDQNYLNRLADLSAGGQNAAARLGGFGAQSSANIGNIAMQGANQRGQAVLGGASAINNAIQGGMSNYLLSNYLDNAPPSGWNRSPF